MPRFARPLALSLLVSSACAEETQFGDIDVRYGFSGISRTCAEAGVETVEAHLDNEFQESDLCNLTTGLMVTGVPARQYDPFVVQGVNAEGIVIMDNLGFPDTDESVEVLGDRTVQIDVELSPTPAHVRVSFNVLAEDGFPLAPQATPVTHTFRTELYEDAGTTLMLRHDFIYSELSTVRNVEVPDPARVVNGNDLDAITIDVLNPRGEPLSGIEFKFAPPGPGRVIDVRIDCVGETCTGVLMGAVLEDG